jgi:DNA helicase IV
MARFRPLESRLSAPVHDSDSLRQSEIDNEQRYVSRVYTRLGELRRTVAEVEKGSYGLARVGTHAALVERDAMVFHAARRRHALDAEYEGLVFGRLDLAPEAVRSDEYQSPVEPAVPGGEARYVGRLGLRDETHESLVVDWRAPAAAPFYRATPTERMGVVRRRMLRSSGETVVDVEDDLLDPTAAPPDMAVIGDGALLATLSRATGRGMRDIVATIQREQDDPIRSPALGVTIVRGGPGTGKTAVALHRAAYLLYADRNRFESGGVLVVGPSEVFVSYVSRVLPSLGEETVTLRSLGQIVEKVSATRHDSGEIAAIKGSLRMARVLARAAHDVPDSPDRLRLLYRGELLELNRRALDDARRAILAPGPKRNAVRAKAAGYLLDTLWRQSVELLPAHRQQTREDFASEIAGRREFTQFMGAWWPILTPRQVLDWLADPARLRQYGDGILSRVEMDRLAASYAQTPATDGPTVADVALLDELDDLLGSPPVRTRLRKDPFHVVDGISEVTTYADRMAAARAVATERPDDYREYAHVVVDEAQDVSPMQWRMIGRRGQYASWTIVGDPAQAAWADAAEAGRAMDTAIGSRRRSEYTLTTNYRNAAEIFDLAAAVIRRAEPNLELPTAVRSSGVPPVHRAVTAADLRDATRTATTGVLAEVAGTVGVIAPMAARDEVAGWFADVDSGRLQVVGSLEAKGMEYDGVVVVEPAAISAEGRSGVRTLYVALSRATQRLVTVGTDDSWRP